MKRNAVVFPFFLEVIFFGVFSGKFVEIWAEIIRTPQNFPAPTPMMTHNILQQRIRRLRVE